MPAKKSKSTSRKSSSSSRKTRSRRSPAAPKGSKARSRSKSKAGPRPAPVSPESTPGSGLSLDRKLDILGVVLVFLGLLLLLVLLSTTRSPVTGGALRLIRTGFGWGIYLLPLALMGLGLWLVLRHFDRIALPSPERGLGLLLMYTNLHAWLHFTLLPTDSNQAFALAAEGLGGGYLGASLYGLLHLALGVGGTAIALAAWGLISLILTLDKAVMDLFGWIPAMYNRVVDWIGDMWAAWRARRAEQTGGPEALAGYSPLPALSHDADLEGGEEVGSQPVITLGLRDEAAPREWVLPQIDEILEPGDKYEIDYELDLQRANVIEETLASFGAPANVVEISRGPTITLFGVEPDFIESRSGRTRVRVSKISSLADDLALALSARTIRIQAPVPGKGYVGIEVPNEEASLVALRDVLESEAFTRLKSPLRFALGQDVAGNAVAADLTGMPHLLVAGATGSGKSVCVNSLIACFLLHNTPDDLRLVMVDPKRVELTGYNGIPHLLAPVIVDLERVVGALQWVTREMDQRYSRLAQAGSRNLNDYNRRMKAAGEKGLPHLVVLIDELADLMMLAPDETERTLTRLAQLARATGIHLVIATQRPSVDVVTGLIKANFPARVAFAVASGTDSRVILDQPGAERLLGRGDMLFQAPDAPAPVRMQGTFVSDPEIQRLVRYWRAQAGLAEAAPVAEGGVVDDLPASVTLKQMALWEEMEQEEEQDPLYDDAVDLVRRQGRASISMLQRRLRIGYTRAARLVDTMEARKIIGPPEGGSGAREVLDYGPAAPPAE